MDIVQKRLEIKESIRQLLHVAFALRNSTWTLTYPDYSNSKMIESGEETGEICVFEVTKRIETLPYN
jgi:hypothetical protein